jgi:hypothetical protein
VNKKYLYPEDIFGNKDFMEIYKKCKAYTMVSAEKSYALYRSVKYVEENNIKGDFVECGVYKGGQSMLMAYTLLQEGQANRNIWLYDTYSGMSKPTDKDVSLSEDKQASKIWQKKKRESHNEWVYSSLSDVKRNMKQTEYPKQNLDFVEGKVENTIPQSIPQKISILRLDTDFYESTRHELEHLYPRLVKGGVLIIDDYNSWKGARMATEEYIKENNIKILLSKMDTGAMGVKVE